MAARLTPDEIVKINQLYPRYGSYAAVAREIGRSASAVARYVKLQGTPKVVKTAFRETVRGETFMIKKMLTITIWSIILFLSMSTFAEGLDNIIPDASIWGISADNLKGKYKADYEQCQVGDDEALRISKAEVCSYYMDIYYVFGEEMNTPEGETYYGLSKITYLLSDNELDGINTDDCLQMLEKEIQKVEGEYDSEKKGTMIWKKDRYRIEVGKGKLSKYTGSNDTTVAMVFKGVNIPKPTLAPTPTPKPYNVLSYEGCFRNPEEYKGLDVKFIGKVKQVLEDENMFYLRVGTNNTQKFGEYEDDIVYVEINKSDIGFGRILENDIIEISGQYDGLSTYTSIIGNNITIPKIKAEAIYLTKNITPEPQPEPTPKPNMNDSSDTILGKLGLPDIRINEDFSLQNGKVKYGIPFREIEDVEKAKKSISENEEKAPEEYGYVYSRKYYDRTKHNSSKPKADPYIEYFFDKERKLIGIGYCYRWEDVEYNDIHDTLIKKYGEPIDYEYSELQSYMFREVSNSVAEIKLAGYYTGKKVDIDIGFSESWLLHYNDVYVVIDFYNVAGDSVEGLGHMYVSYNMYSEKDLNKKYKEIQNNKEADELYWKELEEEDERNRERIDNDL